MRLGLEYQKIKRTGFFPALIGGGILAAAVPVVNMAVRSEIYVSLEASPVSILLNANWQLMAMLNILLLVTGACVMYHTEYAGNAIQKMRTLPIEESSLFFGKAVLAFFLCALILALEAAGVGFCSHYWFGVSESLLKELIKNFGYFLLLLAPAALLSLLIASACTNMWISLGIGVVCIFTATILPADSFWLSLFPYALPFRLFSGTAPDVLRIYAAAAVAETLILCTAEVLFLKVRRWFE